MVCLLLAMMHRAYISFAVLIPHSFCVLIKISLVRLFPRWPIVAVVTNKSFKIRNVYLKVTIRSGLGHISSRFMFPQENRQSSCRVQVIAQKP